MKVSGVCNKTPSYCRQLFVQGVFYISIILKKYIVIEKYCFIYFGYDIMGTEYFYPVIKLDQDKLK